MLLNLGAILLPHVVTCEGISSVFKLHSIPRDEYTTYTRERDMGCSGSLAVNTEVQIALASSVLLDMYPEVQLLSYMAILFLTFGPMPFPHWLHHLISVYRVPFSPPTLFTQVSSK